MKTTTVALVAAVYALSTSPAWAQDAPAPPAPAESEAPKTRVERNFEVGRTYGFRMGQEQEDENPMGGSTSTTDTDVKLVVAEVQESGVVLFDVEIVRIKGSMEGAMTGTIEYDSEAAELPTTGLPQVDSQLQESIAIAGHTFRAALAADGTWSVVDGVDAAVEQILADHPTMSSQEMTLPDAIESTVLTTVSSVRPDYPEAGLAVDTSWKETQERTIGPMFLTTKFDYGVKEVGADTATLTVEGKVDVAAADGPMKAQLEMALQGASVSKNDVRGSAVVSLSDGMLETAESVTEHVMEMGGGMGGGGGMRFASTTTTTTKRLDPATFGGGETAPETPAEESGPDAPAPEAE